VGGGLGEAVGEVHDPIFHASRLQGEHDLGDLQGGKRHCE